MVRSVRSTLALAAMVLAAVTLPACGSGGDAPSSGGEPVTTEAASPNSIVTLGRAGISKATLNHWMSTIAGGDFFEISGMTAPSGLVSEPPNYAMCAANLKTLVPSLSQQELRTKCKQFQQAVKQQAIGYLITVDTILGQNAEQGIHVSNQEIQQAFKKLQAAQFHSERETQQYLANRHWSLSDELFIIKRDLLSSKLRSALEARFSGEALVNYVHNMDKKWTEKTSCSPGYVVEGCRQYVSTRAATASGPSAATLIEEISNLRRATRKTAPDINCHNEGKKVACQPKR